jgi:L-asparaginase II
MDLWVESRRGGVVEARHRVHAVIVDGGQVVERVGDDVVTTWRSGAKPFQLEVTAELAGLGRDARDLAIGASSHSAEAVHVERVRSLLARSGCGEPDLFCGAHAPVHGPSADLLARNGERPTPIHNNCSGKHTFMAASCRECGWDRDYRPASHPLQRRILDRVAERAGRRPTTVTDGCGVPCFVLPISAMARAYGELADARDGWLGAIGAAMAQHPRLVSGTGRDDGAAALAATRPIVAKVGALGLMCVAVRGSSRALVLKVESGDGDARPVALAALLRHAFPGLVPDDALAPFHVVKNVVGDVVGDRVARFSG